MQSLIEIAEQENITFKNSHKLTGGDINDVFLLKTPTENLVLKLTKNPTFSNMFQQEAFALQELAKTNTFKIPKICCVGELNNQSYLIMEFIESGTESEQFWEDFGINLAKLHQNTAKKFGWRNDNYIGSLLQHNEYCSDAADFYISQRLQPQIKWAKQKGFTFKSLDNIYKNIAELIPKKEIPALIHGDLWSGNYMVNVNQKPVLIDPAICFASREMDLAMMQLFGCFPANALQTYTAQFPLQSDWEFRIELYQLYYLLVHLNLFGKSYLKSVQQIIKKFV